MAKRGLLTGGSWCDTAGTSKVTLQVAVSRALPRRKLTIAASSKTGQKWSCV